MRKVTVLDIMAAKGGKDKISALTAYDWPTAQVVDEAGVDIILVGDSLGNVVLGLPDTLEVTVDHMIHHCRAVSRGVKRALLAVDMPFMSFQVSCEETVRNSGRMLSEGRAEAVKLEGGERNLESIRRLVDMGIPVMGHLGMTPQSVHVFGGYRVQGKEKGPADTLLADARALAEAGVFSIVLELIPAKLAKRITEEVSVPTIGIGAGPDCDGQILVFHDLLGFLPEIPRHVTLYANLRQTCIDAVSRFHEDVKKGIFPPRSPS